MCLCLRLFLFFGRCGFALDPGTGKSGKLEERSALFLALYNDADDQEFFYDFDLFIHHDDGNEFVD